MKRVQGSSQRTLNPGKVPSPEEDDVDSSAEDAENTGRTKDAFHVDTGLIPQAALDEQGSAELQNLRLSVFSQDVFEQGLYHFFVFVSFSMIKSKALLWDYYHFFSCSSSTFFCSSSCIQFLILSLTRCLTSMNLIIIRSTPQFSFSCSCGGLSAV